MDLVVTEEQQEEQNTSDDQTGSSSSTGSTRDGVPPTMRTVVKSAQAQYFDFIQTVLAKKRNDTLQTKKKKKTRQKKMTKATLTVIERIKQVAWDKLQQEKENTKNV